MGDTFKHVGSFALSIMVTLAGASQSLMAGNNDEVHIKAYYGDKNLERTVVIDVNSMTLESAYGTIGTGAYSANQAGTLNKIYVDTRSSNSMDIMDATTNETTDVIELEHYPRSSEAYNDALGLQLVTGKNKPMASLIDVETDTVVAVVGDNTQYPPNGDYGGGNATGHPFWFDDNRFALIDRPNRVIHVYQITWKKNGHGHGHGGGGHWETQLLSSISTATTVHHFLNAGKKNIFFAIAEGSAQNNYSPMIVKYKLKNNGKLKEKKRVSLSEDGIENMGAHHGDLHPNGKLLYVGSTEGNMYVININKMKVKTVIPVGLGAGHTTFIPSRNIAVVTNHKDTFMSIVDTKKHKLIKNVVTSGEQINGTILQSHTTMVHPNMNYFYAFATDNGIFYELNLETLEVTRTLETGGTPLQGVFLCDGQTCSSSM